MVPAYCQVRPFGEKYATPSSAPFAARPGLTAISPALSNAQPVMDGPAP